MASAFLAIDLDAPPEEVWQLIGGFGSLPDWRPPLWSFELLEGGRVRRIGLSADSTIVERLETFDNASRSYSYSIIESPFPVTAYLATIRVLAGGARGIGSRVEWSGTFTPVDGASEAQAVEIFEGVYRRGLDALAAAMARNVHK
jgi:uncharacterized protein YndB with AHSA1/START domain